MLKAGELTLDPQRKDQLSAVGEWGVNEKLHKLMLHDNDTDVLKLTSEQLGVLQHKHDALLKEYGGKLSK